MNQEKALKRPEHSKREVKSTIQPLFIRLEDMRRDEDINTYQLHSNIDKELNDIIGNLSYIKLNYDEFISSIISSIDIDVKRYDSVFASIENISLEQIQYIVTKSANIKNLKYHDIINHGFQNTVNYNVAFAFSLMELDYEDKYPVVIFNMSIVILFINGNYNIYVLFNSKESCNYIKQTLISKNPLDEELFDGDIINVIPLNDTIRSVANLDINPDIYNIIKPILDSFELYTYNVLESKLVFINKGMSPTPTIKTIESVLNLNFKSITPDKYISILNNNHAIILQTDSYNNGIPYQIYNVPDNIDYRNLTCNLITII